MGSKNITVLKSGITPQVTKPNTDILSHYKLLRIEQSGIIHLDPHSKIVIPRKEFIQVDGIGYLSFLSLNGHKIFRYRDDDWVVAPKEGDFPIILLTNDTEYEFFETGFRPKGKKA